VTEQPIRFETALRAGGAVEGWVAGFDRGRLRALRRGEIQPELEIDLHGLRRDEARRALRAALRDALDAGMRCVQVVHGRGLRSQAGPVLREALPAWLAEAPHGQCVLAFASAEDRHGGASYVLLRRERR
jgi:DNA-nicking Smr family endonuclease